MVAKAAAGIEFTANTGNKHNDTQVACAKKAVANAGTEPRILSKRLSLPSDVIRANRNEPSLVAQIVTAALSTTCLQFHDPDPFLFVRLVRRLGHGGRAAPDARAAERTRRVGR